MARASDPATGTPSAAIRTAGSMSIFHGIEAPSSCMVCHAATAPGTVTVCGPSNGIRDQPSADAISRGAAPLPLIARTSPAGVASRPITSPPGEHMCG